MKLELTKFTKSVKPEEIKKDWWVIDVKDKPLGRVATIIATLLRGKHKPYFTPHLDCGDFVIVINADKVKLTGKKLDKKIYYWHSGWPGGLKSITARELRKKSPEKMIMLAVKRMLPKNKLGRKLLKKLKVYRGPEHKHQAQKPKPYALPF